MSASPSLAQRVLSIPPSPTLAVNAKAKALKATGADVLNFSVGEPDFDTPDHVKQGGRDAIEQGFTKYTPVPGIPELREAVVARLKEDHGWSYTADQVQVACGGKHSLYNICQALVDPGDEVLILAPYWVSYPPMVQLAGGTPVIVPLDETKNFDLDPLELARHVTPRTKGIILNSPSNPAGSLLSSAALEAVARMARVNGWFVVSDDIYETMTYGDGPLPHILDLAPDLTDRVLLSNGVSKSFAMTGWRIGYTIGPEPVIKAMNKVQSHSTSNPSSIAQKAALAALAGPQDFPRLMLEAFRPRRDFIISALRSIAGVTCAEPMGAFYVFPNLSSYFGRKWRGKTLSGSLDLADYLLDEALLATVPGVAFGVDSCIRFSFATSMAVIEEGMARLKNALSGLE